MDQLPEADKETLIGNLSESYEIRQASLRSLTIFNQSASTATFADYEYDYFAGANIYYVGYWHKMDLAIFIDESKRLLFRSRYYFTHLGEFMKQINAVLHRVATLDLSKAIDIGENYVSIEKWFISYGHFKDEAYSLGNFLHTNPAVAGHTAILDYPTDERLDEPNFKHNRNYAKIDKLIFGDAALNAYEMKGNILRLRNLALVGNHITAPTFHAFPTAISSAIRQRMTSRGLATEPRLDDPLKIFVTRSDSYRDIANKSETEALLAGRGFTVINPELISYEALVKAVYSASTIVMFYRSALTNMVYFQRGARVIILKSQSYLHEEITLWQKVIENYGLHVVELAAVENRIDHATLLELIAPEAS